MTTNNERQTAPKNKQQKLTHLLGSKPTSANDNMEIQHHDDLHDVDNQGDEHSNSSSSAGAKSSEEDEATITAKNVPVLTYHRCDMKITIKGVTQYQNVTEDTKPTTRHLDKNIMFIDIF